MRGEKSHSGLNNFTWALGVFIGIPILAVGIHWWNQGVNLLGISIICFLMVTFLVASIFLTASITMQGAWLNGQISRIAEFLKRPIRQWEKERLEILCHRNDQQSKQLKIVEAKLYALGMAYLLVGLFGLCVAIATVSGFAEMGLGGIKTAFPR